MNMTIKKLKELQKLIKNFYKNTKRNECFYPSCTNHTIRSHSISKSKILSFLAQDSSTGDIFFLDDNIELDFKNLSISTLHEQKRKLKKSGKNEASTFYGFCSSCDNSFFEKLDNELYYNTNEINFLHAYRAFAYYLQNQDDIVRFINKKITPIQKEIKLPPNYKETIHLVKSIPDNQIIEYKDIAHALPSFKDQDQLLLSSNYPMKGIEFKEKFEETITNSEQFITNYLEADPLYNFTKAITEHNDNLSKRLYNIHMFSDYTKMSFLHIEEDFAYKITGNFVFQEAQNDLFSLTFFPERETNKSHFIFSAISPNKNQDRYLSQIKIKDKTDFQFFVSNLILRQGSNVYFSTDYWNNLSSKAQELIQSKKLERDNVPIKENLFVKR